MHWATGKARNVLGILAAWALLGGVGCNAETEHLPDNTVAQAECGQRLRIDAQVKAQAALDYAKAGKTCEPYNMQLSSKNSQETLWQVCCDNVRFNYIYYPEKCVVRKASGPVACN